LAHVFPGDLLQVGKVTTALFINGAGGCEQSPITGIHHIEDMLGGQFGGDRVPQFGHGQVFADFADFTIVGNQIADLLALGALLLVAMTSPEQKQ